MGGAFGSVIAIVFLVIIGNFIMLYVRLRRDLPRKPSRWALEEEEAAKLREREIYRRIEREQEDAIRRIELQNHTFELFEEVRRRAAATEAGSGSD